LGGALLAIAPPGARAEALEVLQGRFVASREALTRTQHLLDLAHSESPGGAAEAYMEPAVSPRDRDRAMASARQRDGPATVTSSVPRDQQNDLVNEYVALHSGSNAERNDTDEAT